MPDESDTWLEERVARLEAVVKAIVVEMDDGSEWTDKPLRRTLLDILDGATATPPTPGKSL